MHLHFTASRMPWKVARRNAWNSWDVKVWGRWSMKRDLNLFSPQSLSISKQSNKDAEPCTWIVSKSWCAAGMQDSRSCCHKGHKILFGKLDSIDRQFLMRWRSSYTEKVVLPVFAFPHSRLSVHAEQSQCASRKGWAYSQVKLFQQLWYQCSLCKRYAYLILAGVFLASLLGWQPCYHSYGSVHIPAVP